MKKYYAVVAFAFIIMVIGCQTKDRKQESLSEKTWELTEIQYDTLSQTTFERTMTLRFDADKHTVSGRGDCNSFMGTYTVSGKDSVKINITATTLAFCPNMDLEKRYIHFLNQAVTYSARDKKLTLRGADHKNYATFVAQEETNETK